jgi:hypothetical protein
MGGVVSDITGSLGSAINNVGQGLSQSFEKTGGFIGGSGGILGQIEGGITDTVGNVSDVLAEVDDAIPPEAKIAAAIYLASQGIPTGAEGGILSGANAAVAADNAYLASSALSQAQAAAAAGSALGPTTYNEVLSQLTQYPRTLPSEFSTALGDMAGTGAGGGITSGGIGGAAGAGAAASSVAAANAASGGGGAGNLVSGALNFAKENPLAALGIGTAAAKALGGSTPTSSTATTSIDPDVKAAYLRNLEEARTVGASLGQRQFAPYPEYNLGMVQQYMNPYENQVVQNTLADIERARQGQISAEGARATAAGAFGGTRQAVTRSLVDEAALRNAGNLAAQLRQGGFAQAQNLGLAQQQMMQQYEQQKLDAARGLGLERLNIAQGALSLQPARIGESTTSPIYRNQAASGLGGALGGAQLGKLIGGTANPEYAGYGAAAGGLLGFLG